MKTIQQFMTQKKAVVTLVGTFLTTTLISTPALAQEFFGQQYFPGSMCQPYVLGAYKDLVVAPGGFYNNSSTTVDITCPISQRFPEDNAGSVRSALITVYKGNSQNLSCSLYTQDGLGNSSSSKSGSTTNQGNSILIYTPATPKGLVYNLLCIMPPNSGILNYGLYEPAQ